MGSKMRIAASIQGSAFHQALLFVNRGFAPMERGTFGGKLLTPASLRKMTHPLRVDYACGLYVKRVNGHLMIEMMGTTLV